MMFFRFISFFGKIGGGILLLHIFAISSSAFAVPLHKQFSLGNVSIPVKSDTLSFSKLSITNNRISGNFVIAPDVQAQCEYFITFPNGNVIRHKHAFPYCKDGVFRTGIPIPFSLHAIYAGDYHIEWSDLGGYPIIRGIIRVTSPYSVTPIAVPKIQTTQINIYKQINMLRSSLGREILQQDPLLQKIAIRKARDMAYNGYVGHYTKDGKDIADMLREGGYTITGSVGENVAGGKVTSIQDLQGALELSGSHKYNMLYPSWKRVGIGTIYRYGRWYIVQVFSE